MSTERLERLAADLRRIAAAASVRAPRAGGEWTAFRPGDTVPRPAVPAEVQAFTEATTEQAGLAYGLLEMGDEAAAVGLDLLYETADAALGLGRATAEFGRRWDELERLLTWAGERLETP